MGEAKRRREGRLARPTTEQRLHALGIDTARPGFYDDEVFVREERLDPNFLENYARLVRERKYDATYLVRARRTISFVASELAAVFAERDLQRACLMGAMVLSRMLEQAGIWNAVVQGGFAARLVGVEGSGRYFHVFTPPIAAGTVRAHAWVFAPPFYVVDITAKLQPWDLPDLAANIPTVVLIKEPAALPPKLEVIVDPDVFLEHRRRGQRFTLQTLFQKMPTYRAFISDFPGAELRTSRVLIDYQPTNSGAPDSPFDEMGDDTISFRPREIWETKIKPRLP